MMNYGGNFNRGRGFRPRGTRGEKMFGRCNFTRSSFQHRPPRRHPALFAPYQPNNNFYQPQINNPQFRPNNRRGFNVHNVRYFGPNRFPAPREECNQVTIPMAHHSQVESNRTNINQPSPPLGSEEERQQKITETADQLKQKLSYFNHDNVTTVWTDDASVPSNSVEDGYIENRGIPELKFEPPELSLTRSDLQDIGKINYNNVELDNLQQTADQLNVTSDRNSNVIILTNEEENQTIHNNQISNMTILPNHSECMEVEEANKYIDNSYNLEQSNLQKDESVSLEIDSSYNSDTLKPNVSQNQQDFSQKTDTHLTDSLKEQNVSTIHNLHDTSFASDPSNQNISRKVTSQNDNKTITDLEYEGNVSNSQIHANNSTLDTVVFGNHQVSQVKEDFLLNNPATLSQEQKFPLNFDPRTPPPILLTQDQQQSTSSSYPMYDLPLFNPMEPPPNMKHLFELQMPCDTTISNNYLFDPFNRDTHMKPNTFPSFTFQQSPLEMSSENNDMLLSYSNAINLPPYTAPSNNNVNVNFPPILHPMYLNTYVSPTQEPSANMEPSNSNSNMNEDDKLNDMQEAMAFAEQMINVTKEKNSISQLNSESLSNTCVSSVNDLDISLPPGEPKTNANKLKKIKPNKTHRNLASEKQKTSDHLSSEKSMHDGLLKSKDLSLMDNKDRPKVAFNLNNDRNKVTEWKENIKRITHVKKDNIIAQPVKSRDKFAASSKKGKNLDGNKLNQNQQVNIISEKDKSGLKNTALSDSITGQHLISPNKKIKRQNVHTEMSKDANVSHYQGAIQKSVHSQIEKDENISSIIWKNKIIDKFLKMNKNDICNMVNNTTLRKFDILMKHLVKEKKPILSLQARHLHDEKMRLYNQQEFMKQLNAMLEPDATVSVKDLPMDFVHHLNEVLQLDILSHDQDEHVANSNSQTHSVKNTNNLSSFDTPITGCANETVVLNNDVNPDSIINISHTTETKNVKNIQRDDIKINDLNLKNDSCNATVPNETSDSSRLSILQHDLDDIFSQVTKKGQASAITMRKNCNIMQKNKKKYDKNALKLEQRIAYPENDRSHQPSKNQIEKHDKWKIKEQEDPHAYRNLTKEEWEAKCRMDQISLTSTSKKIRDDDKINLSDTMYTKNSSSERRYPLELSGLDIRYKTVENDKCKQPDRHISGRKYHSKHSRDTGNYDSSNDSNSSSNSSNNSNTSNNSSTTSNSGSSNHSNKKIKPTVTKLLRIIKENEKIAKKKSLNEKIRDEINAEIMQQRKEEAKGKKSRKSHKWQNKKMENYKRYKEQCNFSSSCSEENSNKQENFTFLTESEIKKEIIGNQITQEVIIKEELDISQETNGSEQMSIENTSMCLLPKSYNKSDFSSSWIIPPTTSNDTVQLQIQDKPLIISPTQLKTKAQLKQMPEIANADGNETYLASDLTVLNNISKHCDTINQPNVVEPSDNAEYQVTKTDYIQDKINVPLAIDKVINESNIVDDTVQTSYPIFNENSMLSALDGKVCTHTETIVNDINMQNDSESPVAVDITNKSLSTSDILNVTSKQGICKKIDIKTYYERKIQRRMNEQRERKTENSATCIQNLLSTSTIGKTETVNKAVPISTCSGSIQDQVEQNMENSNENKLSETALKYHDLNRVINIKDTLKKVGRSKSKNEPSLTINKNENLSSSTATKPKLTFKKGKKCKKNNKYKEIKTNDELQNRVSSDPKKFKNIRSEGSKELKLKKEMSPKIPKIKKNNKRNKRASKSVSPSLTKKYPSTEVKKAENIEKLNEEFSDKTKIESEQSTEFVNADKVTNNNIEVESLKVSLDNIDDKTKELTDNINKVKECSLNPELIELLKIQDVNRDKEIIDNIDACEQLSSLTTDNGEASNIKDNTENEFSNKEDYNPRKISTNAIELGILTVSKTIPTAETSVITRETSKENLSSIDQQCNEMMSMGFSSNYEDISQKTSCIEEDTEKSNSQKNINDRDLVEGVMKKITELEIVPQLDDVSVQDNKCDLLISANMELNDANENAIKSDNVSNNLCKSTNVDEDSSSFEKTAILSSISDENCQIRHSRKNSIASPDSPFKGFLRESISEQSNLYNFELNEINKEDRSFLDNCNVNCLTDTDNMSCKEISVKRPHNCETSESTTDYTNNNISFTGALLALDKGSVTKDKTNKLDLMVDENREKNIEKSPTEIVPATLYEDNDINTEESNETENPLMNKETHILDIELENKRSIFINEEEGINQNEARLEDLKNKLSTTADPNLSEALDIATSNEELMLPEHESIEHLNKRTFSGTDATETIFDDKLPNFGSSENDMLYLDIRLQNNITFDNKNNVCSPVSQQSPQYDTTPETTTITHSCDELLHDNSHKSEQYKLDFNHILSINDDYNLLNRAPIERVSDIIDVPRTLNIPTKAALKEAATNLSLKSVNNTLATIEQAPTLKKAQQNEVNTTHLNSQVSVCHANVHDDANTCTREIQYNTILDPNAILFMQNNIYNMSTHTNTNIANTNESLTSSVNTEKCPYTDVQHSVAVDLESTKGLTNKIEQETQKKSKKAICKNKKKKGKLRNIQNNQNNHNRKRHSKKNRNKNSLASKIENIKQCTDVGAMREIILARMLQIDMEMHKLMVEKLQLHQILYNDTSLIENSISNSSTIPKTKDDIQSKTSLVTTPHLAQSDQADNIELNNQIFLPKQSPIEQRQSIVSHSLKNNEILHYTDKLKTPAINKKKKLNDERRIRWENEAEKDLDEKIEQEITFSTTNKPGDIDDVPEDNVEQDDKNIPIDCNTENDKKIYSDIDNISKSTISKDLSIQLTYSIDKEIENTECISIHKDNINKKDEILSPSKMNFQTLSTQMHSKPDPSSIYSDDSTWDFMTQNTVSERRRRKPRGLVLLEATLKQELALSRRKKAVARKNKKKQLNNFLKSVNNLTIEEEELPLSKLYIRKLQQKRDLLDTLSQKKDDETPCDSKTLENMDEVINAVAENRVKDLYEFQSEMQDSNNIPVTSNISIVSQPDKHQLYIDAEANANSDWASREKESIIDKIALQEQDSNDAVDRSNHIFTTVNNDKTIVHDERNMEPDSSIMPEENRSMDCEYTCHKDNNTVLRNFDLKVSVPKTLITGDFNLGLLQKYKSTEGSIVSTGLVGSTTSTFTNSLIRSEKDTEEHNTNSHCLLRTVNSIMDKDYEEDIEIKLSDKSKYIVDTNDTNEKTTIYESQKEKIDDVSKSQSALQAGTINSEYINITENEDSVNSITLKEHDKIETIDIANDSNISDRVEIYQERLKVKSELSNDAIVLRQDYLDAEDIIQEKETNNSENRLSPTFQETSRSDQYSRSPILFNQGSGTSEESNEILTEEKCNLECTSASIFSFNKTVNTIGNTELSNKVVNRRKPGKPTPVRRSSRCSNENVKPNKTSEIDSNSNSSEQEPAFHEKNITKYRRGKSPTWPMDDEGITNMPLNVKKNRATQRAQNANSRKVLATTESETKHQTLVKPLTTAFESTSSKNKTVAVAKKRKQDMTSRMMNCKVRLVDCKYNLIKLGLNPAVLGKLGITAINSQLSSDTACIERTACDQDTATISTIALEENPVRLNKLCDNGKSEIETLDEKLIKETKDNNVEESTSHLITTDEQELTRIYYTIHKGPILDIKVFENSFLAASEDGKIYRYNQTSNEILNIYKGHKSAVTCLHIYKSELTGVIKEFMYSGSLDGTLCCFDIMTGALVKKPVRVNSPIQCMDQEWGTIYIGTKSGHVSRFHIKTGALKGNNIKFSDKSVLALKATNEGPRKILIVASRNQPITIKDAQTGLFLRMIYSQKNHTVYSLIRHYNLIYCGTSSTSINVYDFTTGEHAIQYDAGVGIVCMRFYEEFLFAGCYDGNIYVFDTKDQKLVCSIPGPGNMLLSIEVVHDKIIAGSKDKRLHSWQIPTQVRALLHRKV